MSQKLADAVERLVIEYAKEAGLTDDPVATSISDLLADLRHLCDRWKLEWHEVDRRGYNHYVSEIHDNEEESADGR